MTKARLDADRTAKPKTRIVSHPNRDHCVGPGTRLVRPEYEAEDGTRTPLDADPDTAPEGPEDAGPITVGEDDMLALLGLASLGLDSRELHPDVMADGEELVDRIKRTMGWVMGPDGVLVTREDLAVYAAEAKRVSK